MTRRLRTPTARTIDLGGRETLEKRHKAERKQGERRGLTASEARPCCGWGHEGRGVWQDAGGDCCRRSGDAEEPGCGTGEAAAGDVMFLPRLCDLFALRWYSMGDWRAAGQKRRCQKRQSSNV